MSKVDLVGIAQDLFLLNDLAYKYSVGKVNESLNIYFYRTSLEGEKINLFLLETKEAKIVIPASNEWDGLELDGLYKITCINCEGKFIFKEYNHIQTIKSASTSYISPISDNEWELEYSILDEKIRRFNIINQLCKQESTDWVDKALSIIFNDEAEILAEKIPTMKIMKVVLESVMSSIDSIVNTSKQEVIPCYVKINNNDIVVNLEDKGDSYYVVNLNNLSKCFLYQQYITLFYIRTYYIVGTYTEIRLVDYNGKKYIVFVNQNDDMIIDMTFVEVIDVLVRGETKSSDNSVEHTENNIGTGNNDVEVSADEVSNSC
jgi:hypothetical protein